MLSIRWQSARQPGTKRTGFKAGPELTLVACVLSRFSRVWLFATTWTAARQAPLSMGFSRQGCWTALPCLSPGDLPDPGIKAVSPVSPALQVDSLPPEPPGKPILVETLAIYLTSLCLYFFIHKNNNKKAHRSHEDLKYFKHSKHFKQILSHSKENMWAFRS